MSPASTMHNHINSCKSFSPIFTHMYSNSPNLTHMLSVFPHNLKMG